MKFLAIAILAGLFFAINRHTEGLDMNQFMYSVQMFFAQVFGR